jgi:hypothetical protein
MEPTLILDETVARQFEELKESARRGDPYAKEAVANINVVMESFRQMLCEYWTKRERSPSDHTRCQCGQWDDDLLSDKIHWENDGNLSELYNWMTGNGLNKASVPQRGALEE